MAQDAYVASAILTSGATLTTLRAGGLRGLIDLIIAANPAIANPTVATTAVENGGGSSGGLLPAGDYFLYYTFVGPGGETTVGTSVIASALSVTATHIPRVTLPATPSGARCKNLYATAAAGLAGTQLLYATGITGTTFDMSFAAGTNAIAPPTANTTGITGDHAERLRALVSGQSDRVFNKLSEQITSFCQGDGTLLADVQKMVIDYGDMFSLLKKLMDDLGVLVVANPGTLSMTVNGRKRTF